MRNAAYAVLLVSLVATAGAASAASLQKSDRSADRAKGYEAMAYVPARAERAPRTPLVVDTVRRDAQGRVCDYIGCPGYLLLGIGF
jgi:hypothetical protein